MKILTITDTHGVFNAIYEQNKDKIKDFDFIVLLGDHTPNDIKIITKVFDVSIYRVAGNHDMPDLYKNQDMIDIHNKLVNTKPSFTGWQGSHKYKENQYYGFTQEESIDFFKKMNKADILFSHDGPFGYGVMNDAHCGLKGILMYIKKKKPKTVIYGHNHNFKNYKLRRTNCFCVYQMTLFEFDSKGNVISYECFDVL